MGDFGAGVRQRATSPSSKHQMREYVLEECRSFLQQSTTHLWNPCQGALKLLQFPNTDTFDTLFMIVDTHLSSTVSILSIYISIFPCCCHLLLTLSLPDLLPSFSSSSCPSIQSSLRRGRWRHKAGHPAPPTPPAGRGKSRQPSGTTGSSGCKHSSLQSGDKVSRER